MSRFLFTFFFVLLSVQFCLAQRLATRIDEVCTIFLSAERLVIRKLMTCIVRMDILSLSLVQMDTMALELSPRESQTQVPS